MFYKVLITHLLWEYPIFIIKSNPICENNNSYHQNLFKKSEIASKQKALSIVVKSSILDLAEFLDLSLLNYITTTLH